MSRQRRYRYDEKVLVNFDGTDYPGEIDAIDFEGDPEYPYRVWYDTPRREPSWGKNDPIEIECEWVKIAWLSRVPKPPKKRVKKVS